MEVSSTILESSILTNINIVPSKGNIMRTVDPSTVPFAYSDIYDSNNFFRLQQPHFANHISFAIIGDYQLQ